MCGQFLLSIEHNRVLRGDCLHTCVQLVLESSGAPNWACFGTVFHMQDGKKNSKAPKIQRLVTPQTLQRKRAKLAFKKDRREKVKTRVFIHLVISSRHIPCFVDLARTVNAGSCFFISIFSLFFLVLTCFLWYFCCYSALQKMQVFLFCFFGLACTVILTSCICLLLGDFFFLMAFLVVQGIA